MPPLCNSAETSRFLVLHTLCYSVLKTTKPSISEVANAMTVNIGLHDNIHFRLPKPMAVCLRTRALMEKVETSTLVRVLVAEALEARGVNWLTGF